ncbi:MAG: ribonuclease H [Aureispira sp.]|nr:ribonuclease H [Aureispira sp.]
MSKKKPKFYVVWSGHEPGVYKTWKECKKQVDGYTGARYKSFGSLAEAEDALLGNSFDYIQKKDSKPKARISKSNTDVVWKSISVDAACSGNPGKMEYRGVETDTGKQIFHLGPFMKGTNNVGEFLALVHGLALLKKQGSDLPIYSDSKIAMGWVAKKKMNSKLQRGPNNKTLFELVARAEKWLKSNTYTTTILKWQTRDWGEIPADFGRK